MKLNKNISLFAVCLFLSFIIIQPTFADESIESILVLGNSRIKMTSYFEKRIEHVIRQKKDYSCGAAAIATFFSYHIGKPVTEAQVLEGFGKKTFTGNELVKTEPKLESEIKQIVNRLGKSMEEEILREEFVKVLDKSGFDYQTEGALLYLVAEKTDFNLADLVIFAKNNIPTNVVVIKVSPINFMKLRDEEKIINKFFALLKFHPLIVKLTPNNGSSILGGHFTVVKRFLGECSNKYVYLADPTQGNIIKKFSEFKSEWMAMNENGEKQAIVLAIIIKNKSYKSKLVVNCPKQKEKKENKGVK